MGGLLPGQDLTPTVRPFLDDAFGAARRVVDGQARGESLPARSLADAADRVGVSPRQFEDQHRQPLFTCSGPSRRSKRTTAVCISNRRTADHAMDGGEF